MSDVKGALQRLANRRKFLKNGMIAAGATMGTALLCSGTSTFALDRDEREDDHRAPITRGDVAILTFLSALEEVEEDLGRQYAELGGTQDNEVSGANGAVYSGAHDP